MERIKVTAEYVGEKESKFDALFEQYQIAEKIAQETKSYKQPLIDAMGKVKLQKIYEQLDTIIEYLHKISEIDNNQWIEAANGTAYEPESILTQHTVKVKLYPDGTTDISFDGYTDIKDFWFKENGIITNWNKYKLYQSIEADCIRQITEKIKCKESKIKEINQTHDNMINN